MKGATCPENGCFKRLKFGCHITEQKQFCSVKHAKLYGNSFDYVDLTKKRCTNCKKTYIAINNMCSKCDMFLNKKNYLNLCKSENCIKIGRFGLVIDKKDIHMYCDDHKHLFSGDEKIIDLTRKRCQECRISRPSFGDPVTKIPSHCVSCKPEDYVNVVSKMCVVCNKTRSTFGDPIIRIPSYCVSCKPEDYIDVVNKMCIICNKKIPVFGDPVTKIPSHCVSCKPEEYVDVVSKMCVVCNKTKPAFGDPVAKIPSHCVSCKPKDYVNVVSKMCVVCNKTKPVFGDPVTKIPSHCVSCKPEEYINVKDKKCLTYLCDIQVGNKYRGYCYYCFINTFPNEPVTRNYRTKERLVVDFAKKFLEQNYADKNYKIHCDKPLLCNRRPDIYIEISSEDPSEEEYYIIIEIDEFQHRDNRKNDPCETVRTEQIMKELNKSGVFIRFNPDAYVLKNQKNSSCFYLNQKGVYVINDKYDWQSRLLNLQYYINYWINHKPDFKDTPVVYLYYDDIL